MTMNGNLDYRLIRKIQKVCASIAIRDRVVRFVAGLLVLAMAFTPLLFAADSVDGEEEPLDSDGDGMPDEWEDEVGLNKHYASDAWYDLDQDGYRNLAEYLHGTNATNETLFPDIKDEDDLDGDGVCNFGEYIGGTAWNDSGEVPVEKDTDGDGLDDVFELIFGNDDDTTYKELEDLNPCDTDTDHDGYQVDRTNDDNDDGQDGIRQYVDTAGADGFGMVGTDYGPEAWEDYDDDRFIEGFSDFEEIQLGSNPAYPNSWEAFLYGWNFFPGEADDGIHGLHRYFGKYDNSGDYEGSLIRWVGNGMGDAQTPFEAFDNNVNRDNDPATGNGGQEFSVPPALSRDGWFLVKNNYCIEPFQITSSIFFESYYNPFYQSMRIYLHFDGKPHPAYGALRIRSINGSSALMNNKHQVIFSLSAINNESNLMSSHWYFVDFPLFYEKGLHGVELQLLNVDRSTYDYDSSRIQDIRAGDSIEIVNTRNPHSVFTYWQEEQINTSLWESSVEEVDNFGVIIWSEIIELNGDFGVFNLLPGRISISDRVCEVKDAGTNIVLFPSMSQDGLNNSIAVNARVSVNPRYSPFLDKENITVCGKIFTESDGNNGESLELQFQLERIDNNTFHFRTTLDSVILSTNDRAIFLTLNCSIQLQYLNRTSCYFYKVVKSFNLQYQTQSDSEDSKTSDKGLDSLGDFLTLGTLIIAIPCVLMIRYKHLLALLKK